jgi:1-aminocyclopropane-1-carboxylate deaminase/D-cysteine desulfhydrase-like pyridoxal-dependent ACC family enzyme
VITPRSAVEPLWVRGTLLNVKRDDLIDPLLSGNKYRKLQTLVDTPASALKRIVSYGGTQSNAMLSIAALCRMKGWGFRYYSKPLSGTLAQAPSGNLKAALELGMELVEVSHDVYGEVIAALRRECAKGEVFVPQGGADPLARTGVEALAAEIEMWRRQAGVAELTVATPSGTGTTARYLARALPHVAVVTTAVVGDGSYLLEQMARLGPPPENLEILEAMGKHPFAKPAPQLLDAYRELLDAGLEIDLIYGARMWHELFAADRIEPSLLYVHSGGLSGNATMLERYRYEGMAQG